MSLDTNRRFRKRVFKEIETKLKQNGFSVNRPLKGLGIGQQQQRLSELIR